MSDYGDQVSILLYSDNANTRRAVMEAVGARPGKGLPGVNWVEAATADGAVMAFDSRPIDALVFDGEAQKVGGMALLRRLNVEYDEVPPSLVLIARQQDEWLAQFAGTKTVVAWPLDPIAIQEAVASLVRSIRR